MSTTLNIIPTTPPDLTFGQVLSLSEAYIHAFLRSINLPNTIQLQVNIHGNREEYLKAIQAHDRFEWAENEYAWFSIQGIPGGTDAYCTQLSAPEIDPENPWWRLEDLEERNTCIENLQQKLEQSKSIDRCWYLRRSAGQPGIIALTYGCISAAVATLTNGIIWSDDGAWDYARFPADGKHFLEWYFKPDQALHADNADWARRCIEGIELELNAPQSHFPKVEPRWWHRLLRKG